MIDNLFDVLYVAKTGKIKPDASLTDNLYGKKFYDAHSGIITTVTGNPVSIITNKAQNAISTLLSYSPKQSGSGDPSPSNVRPIEGWTEANLFGCGKNLFDKNGDNIINAYQVNNVITEWANVRTVFIPCKVGVTYTVSKKKGTRFQVFTTTDLPSGGVSVTHVYSSASQMTSESITCTTQAGDNYLCAFIYNSTADTGTAEEMIASVQIEVGSRATDYAPFITPTTITESLGGTYYGFEIDVERGVLRSIYKMVDMGDLSWVRKTDGAIPYFRHDFTDSALTQSDRAFMCDCYKNVAFPVIYSQGENYAASSYGNGTFLVSDTDYNTKEDFATAVTGQKLVYELATPLELPLTPQTVALLAGNNTLWTDGDNIEITYKARG